MRSRSARRSGTGEYVTNDSGQRHGTTPRLRYEQVGADCCYGRRADLRGRLRIDIRDQATRVAVHHLIANDRTASHSGSKYHDPRTGHVEATPGGDQSRPQLLGAPRH